MGSVVVRPRRPTECGVTARPVTAATLSAWVRECVATAGDDSPADFSARSLRIGGATEMHAIGANPAAIQALGRWAGDTQRIYTRMPAGRALQISAALSSAPHDPTLEDLFADYTQSRRR